MDGGCVRPILWDTHYTRTDYAIIYRHFPSRIRRKMRHFPKSVNGRRTEDAGILLLLYHA